MRGMMILKEMLQNRKSKIRLIIIVLCLTIVFGVGIWYSKNRSLDYTVQEQHDADMKTEEIQKFLGEWKVTKYLAEAVEVQVDNISQEEYSATEKIEQEVREKYLNKVLLIEQENIEQVGSWANEFDSEDYSYEDWESLFLVYRQPLEIELSFPCIGGYFYLKDCEDELNIILDNDNRVYLYIKGLFFQLEKVEE